VRDARPQLEGVGGVLALPCVAALLAARLIGPGSPAFGRFCVVCLLALYTARAARLLGADLPWGGWLLRASSLLPVPLALFATDGGHQTDLFCVVAVCVACALATHGRPGAGAFRTAARAVAVFAGVYLVSRYSSLLWLGLEGVAAIISGVAGWFGGARLHLGPTPAGVWALILAFAMSLPLRPGLRERLRTRARPIIAYVLAGVALAITLVALQPLIEGAIKAAAQAILTPPAYLLGESDQPGRIPPGATAGLGSVILILLLVPLGRRLGAVELADAQSAAPALRRAWLGLPLLALGVGLLVSQPSVQPATGAIAIYEDGFFDLTRPERGRYGLIQAGLYGGLKELLARSGQPMRVIDREALRQGLGDIAVVVLINPKQRLEPELHEALWKFVRGGGGLLVLGDHTDLFGIMSPLNELLSPLGITFEFDSAYPLRRHWQHSLEVRPHPITAGVKGALEAQIGTGASLRLSSAAARPLIVGRHAFGDYGNRLNDGQGGLLGDYRYQLGERLGDLVLVAAAEVGQGRVVVFGDTSTFQVLGLPFAHGFTRQLFAYLAQPTPSRLGGSLLGGLLVVAGLGLWFAWGGASTSALLLVAVVTAGEAGALLVPHAPLPPLASPGSVAVVDARHSPLFAFEFFATRSYGGLFTAAHRAGFLPVADHSEGPGAIDAAGMAMFLAPARFPGATDLAAIERLLARGGTLFVAAGGQFRGPANALLKLCGLRIDPVPLGPVQYPWQGTRVDFFDAWAISAEDPARATAHATSKGFAVVMETVAGGGRCIAIGDHRFLDDERFEGERQFHAANVRFMDALLAGELRP